MVITHIMDSINSLAKLRGYTSYADSIWTNEETKERVHILYHPSLDVNVLTILEEEGTYLIIVYQELGIQLKRLKPFMARMEVFQADELRILLRGHRLVPKFIKIGSYETAQVETAFRKDKLPCMLDTDPMSRLHGFKTGDIIRIERRSAGEIYYRRIVDGSVFE